MRISDNKLNPSLKNQIIKTFSQAVADLKNLDEVELFLKDFFNETELETYTKRLAIIYWLKKNRGYTNIKNNLKVSSATIASIEKTLDSPGVKLIVKKLEAEEWANVWTEKIKKFTGRI